MHNVSPVSPNERPARVAVTGRWKPWANAFVAAGCVALAVFVFFGIGEFGWALTTYFGSIVWLIWDAGRVQLQRYHTRMAHEPVILGVMCVTAWPLIFPWYVAVRESIRLGFAGRRGQEEAF